MEQEIVKVIKEEAERMQYGKALIEVTINKGKVTNLQFETRKSVNINYGDNQQN